MSVLDRSELEASPLADLHAIADQLGLDGFRRLRKADLIDAILGEPGKGGDGSNGAATADEERERPARRRRLPRARSAKARAVTRERDSDEEVAAGAGKQPETGKKTGTGKGSPAGGDRSAEGVVELLGNGSAFLRVDPPEPSDDDVYISAAQVRRCELVSGDRVTGPVRTPRRSERYPSLVRIDTINGSSADAVSESAHYEDLPVAYPSERLALNAGDPTLDAIEWLTPLGRGSRAVIVGPPRAGKTETLRRLLGAVTAGAAAAADDGSGAAETAPVDWPGATAAAGGKAGSLEVTVVLAGARPEEIADWREGRDGLPVPVATLSFAASADAQGQAVERAIDAAKRVAARGADAVVLIDGLDGMHPPAARKALAAARNLRDGGSLTVIATAARPFGGETTVIALDAGLTDSGLPILDLAASGTLKPELLVGEDGARAIAKARAEARG
jgi:transcription termination factor Rho